MVVVAVVEEDILAAVEDILVVEDIQDNPGEGAEHRTEADSRPAAAGEDSRG